MLPLRQYRIDSRTRDKFADTKVTAANFIEALFITDSKNEKTEITGFPDVYRYGYDTVIDRIDSLLDRGIDKVLLFAVPDKNKKDDSASYAMSSDSIIPRAIKKIKKIFPSLTIFTDICVCSYTRHGHCGIVMDRDVDNNATLTILARMARLHAEAGADWVCPSAMMDGQVEAIRKELDSRNLQKTSILSYSAKYASGLYGPFRNAADSSPSFGDRKTYQMDIRNSGEAIIECWSDIKEGADAIMVKPALFYLDIIAKIRREFYNTVLAAYLVSGEYSMLSQAIRENTVPSAYREAVIAIARAGADWIISYNTDILLMHMEKEL
ncbi:porphobilinogen synthase [Spirochaetia bacterium 38H-sp]|uniref:Delta-aminolevulinic acid dehydratase n=1 Tax=Rarispira pelagica TaxID=3141764 RepID=A0ABU9UAB1_9SPIR